VGPPWRARRSHFSRVSRELALRATADAARTGGGTTAAAAADINKTLTRLGQILDVADEAGLIERNPTRINPRNRRLKAAKPRRVWLDRAEQIEALLAAAGRLHAGGRSVGRRALLATLVFAGLRVTEACQLRWRDVDLAGGRLWVGDAKTDAGRRHVVLLPALLDELKAWRATTRHAERSDFVFATASGRPRDKDNVRNRVLAPAVRDANAALLEDGRTLLPEGLSPHKLRHTNCSLRLALRHDPAVVAEELGHADASITYSVYTHAMRLDPAERERLRALVEGSVASSAPGANIEPSTVSIAG